jgi:hypothetical protein
MALYKRNKIWHTDFSLNGQRFRESLDTSDWREAQRREKELIAQASAGKLAPSGQQFGRLAFSEAADRYLKSRKLELSTRSSKKAGQVDDLVEEQMESPEPKEGLFILNLLTVLYGLVDRLRGTLVPGRQLPQRHVAKHWMALR